MSRTSDNIRHPGYGGPGSGNYWSDSFRSVTGNYMLMGSGTFDQTYGNGSYDMYYNTVVNHTGSLGYRNGVSGIWYQATTVGNQYRIGAPGTDFSAGFDVDVLSRFYGFNEDTGQGVNVDLAANLVGGVEYNYNMAVDANPKSSAGAKGVGTGLSVVSTSLTGYQVYNQIKQGKVCPADATNFVAGTVGITAKFVSWLGYGGKAVSLIGGTASGVGTALTIYQLWDNVYKPMRELEYAPSYILPDGEPVYGNPVQWGEEGW